MLGGNRITIMKQHILGIYTAIYHVEDLGRAKEFYSALLGLPPYFDEPFYVGYEVAGHELGLLPIASTKGQERGCVAYWGVKDMAAACADLSAKGHALFDPVTEVGGGIKVASFLDADGNIVGLIENPHFGNS